MLINDHSSIYPLVNTSGSTSANCVSLSGHRLSMAVIESALNVPFSSYFAFLVDWIWIVIGAADVAKPYAHYPLDV